MVAMPGLCQMTGHAQKAVAVVPFAETLKKMMAALLDDLGYSEAEIEKKAEALMQASQALAQLAGAQGDAGAAPGAGAQADAGKQPDGDVVDAEFTEVKDKK